MMIFIQKIIKRKKIVNKSNQMIQIKKNLMKYIYKEKILAIEMMKKMLRFTNLLKD